MKLSHPHIVTLRSFEQGEEGAFLVMDYVEGGSLDDLLAEKERLTEEEVRTVFEPIAEALDYAHQEKVIHRDIKPSNILISKEGKPYLMDFSIAQLVRETHTKLTGSSSGAPAYMSPEQVRGAKPTPAQDIYNLAATMYECLKGDVPFSRGDIQYQIMHEKPEPLESESDLAARIMRGLAKEPGERPSSAKWLVVGGAVVPRNQTESVTPQEEESSEGEEVGAVQRFGTTKDSPSARELDTAYPKIMVAYRNGQRGDFERFVGEMEETMKTDEEAMGAIHLYDRVSEEYRELLEGMLDRMVEKGFGARVRVQLADRMKNRGALDKAKKIVEGALDVDPRCGEALEALEEIYREMDLRELEAADKALREGKLVEAEAWATKVLERAPGNEQARSIRQRIKAAREEVQKKPGKAPKGCRAVAKSGQELYTGTGCAKEVVHEKSGVELVYVPAGELLMGSEVNGSEKPVHKVKISAGFYIGKYPITNRQFHQYEKETRWRAKLKGEERCPVTEVSWEDAKGYCEWAGLRLPTEAEWEYACRAGSEGRYCFGDDKNRLGDYAWYSENSGGKTHPVGEKKPNAWGLHDMHGNVWEWCEDAWHEDYKGAPTDGSAWTSGGDPGLRVLRGGSWRRSGGRCRSSARDRCNASSTYDYGGGFRCCLGLP